MTVPFQFSSGIPKRDLLFGQLVVDQGITTRQRVEECLSTLSRLIESNVSPLPSLGEILVKKGYLSSSQYDATLRRSQSPPSPQGGSSGVTLPPEVSQAAKDPKANLGKYIRVSLLGAGGMGEVWKAWDRDLARWVALKFLKGEDEDEVSRFKGEAQTAAKLNHQNIGAIYEVGDHAGKAYIAMQYVAGQTLQTFPRDDKNLLAEIIRDMALALHHAHEEGIVHRDIKPANLMVEGKPGPRTRTTRRKPGPRSSTGLRAYVMDFGLAKSMNVASDLSVSGCIVGTPAYMSPEQAKGAKDLDHTSDVYSLGATLYEVLTGRPPFKADDIYGLLRRVVEEDPRPPRNLAPKLERDLETIVLKCLEKERSRRYPNALELAEDLTRYLEGEAIRAHPPSMGYRVRKWCLRRKGVVGVGLAGVVLAGAITAVVVPKWLEEARQREREARGKEKKSRELDRERAKRLEDIEARERARPSLEAGRRIAEAMTLRLRDPDYTVAELGEMAARADTEFQKALATYPGFAQAHLWSGRVFLIAQNKERARKEFDAAIGALPLLAAAYLERVRLRIHDYVTLRHASCEDPGGQGEETSEARVIRLPLEADLKKAAECATQDDERLYALGMLMFAGGDYGKAEESLGLYLKTSPSDGQAYYSRGHSLLHLARYAEAEETLTQAVACDARSATVYASRGAARKAQGNGRGALEDYTKAVKLDPGLTAVYNNRALLREEIGDVKGALEDYARSIAGNPPNPKAYYNRALYLQRTGDSAGAMKDYTRAIETNPRYSRAYGNRGFLKYVGSDLEGAMADYATALEIDPNNHVVYVSRSDVLTRMGRHDEAQADCSRAIKINPDYAPAYYNRGTSRLKAGELDGAIADLTKTVELEPGKARAWNNRGLAKMAKGDLDGALEDFKTTLTLDPTLAKTHSNRGRILRQKGDLEGALSEFRTAMRLDPRDPAGFNNLAWELLTAPKKNLQDPKEALLHAQKASELTRYRVPAYLDTLALALFRTGMTEKAVEMQRKAVKLLPAGTPPAERREYETRLKEFEAARSSNRRE